MNECERATGWVYCAHSIEELTVCRCECTCLDQRHCPIIDAIGTETATELLDHLRRKGSTQ